jgi:hypothetical protein
MKTYIISKKKQKKNRKSREKTSNEFLCLKMRFFNPVDLVVSFPWPHRTPQSEFSIKSYGRLKLRWSTFGFYFFRLSSLFFLSSFSLSSLFLYMKTDEKGLVIRGISVFKFLFLERWIGINKQ